MAKKRPRTKARGPVPEPTAVRGDEAAAPATTTLGAATAWLATRQAFYAALALAAALRVLHLAFFLRSPLASGLVLDHAVYDAWARKIVDGTLGTGEGSFWVDPLYAYALALLYTLFGHAVGLVRVVQAALGVATVGLTGAVGARATRSAAIGNAAALVAALFLPFVHDEMQIEKSTLAVFLSTAALYFFLRGRDRDVMAAGALAGLASLARGNMLVFIPLGVLALLFDGSAAPAATGKSRRAARRRIAPEATRRATTFGVVAAGVVSLATLHNLFVGHELVLTTSNGGANFYIGQFRGNADGTYTPPPFVRPDPRFEQADFQAEAERRVGTTLSASEASAYWRGQALDEIAADPGAFLSRTVRKVWLVAHDFEVPDDDDVELAADFSPVLKLPLFWMGQLAPFALLGAVVWWKRSRELRIVAVVALVYVVSLVAFFVVGRFRTPLAPPVIVLACAGVAWLADRVRAGARRDAGVAGAFVAVGLVLCVWRPAWMERMRTNGLAVTYNDLGTQLLAAHDEDGAIRAYRRAVAIAPDTVVAAERQLGEIYLHREEYREAERTMRDVLRRKPDSGRAKDALVRLYEAMARDPAHAEDAGLRTKLAAAYRAAGREDDAARIAAGGALFVDAARARELHADARRARSEGRWDDAIAATEQAIDVGPYEEDAHYSLGELMSEHASPDAMIATFTRLRAIDPKPQTSLYYWAIGLERRGDTDAAIAKLGEALEVDPAHEMSQLRWCQILEGRGAHEEALRHCDEAVAIFPDFRAAHEERATILDAMGRHADADAARLAAAASNPSTPRRYLYWGRYLSAKGRYAAAIPELVRALQASPTDEEAATLLQEARAHAPDVPADVPNVPTRAQPPSGTAPPAPVPTAPTLDASKISAIADVLRSAPPGSPCWITATRTDPRAKTRAEELASAFADAGWNVHEVTDSDVRVRAGVFLFAADETPPTYVTTVERALRAGGITPTVGNSYRSYYAERRAADPGYQGFPLAEGQSFVLVVGRVE